MKMIRARTIVRIEENWKKCCKPISIGRRALAFKDNYVILDKKINCQ
jgi:hypothetical protein